MSQIEMETEWLRSEILPKILKSGKLVDNYQESKYNTFKVRDIEIDVIGIEEAYMQTFCYRTTIDFEFDGQKLQRKLVVKKTPSLPPVLYENFHLGTLFFNEISFYTEILPEIQRLTGRKFAAPKYFASELNPGSAAAVFEDFAEQGWRLSKNRVGLSLKHALLAVDYLGRFHGLFYAIKHKNPEKFTQLTGGLKESRFATEEMGPEVVPIMKTSLKRVAKAVNTHQPQIMEEFLKKLFMLISDYYQYGKQRVAPREPLATLCHGDFLRNNVAFRYNEMDEPQDVMMFDYQTLRISSPMIDFSVFLAVSLWAEVRYPNFDAIFDKYCSALFESYKNNAKDEVPYFLSRSELLNEYVRFMPYGLTVSSYFLGTLVEPSDVSFEEMLAQMPSEEEIRERVMTAGGELVDREIAHQVKEIQELSQRFKVSIDDGINMVALSKL
ncbi:hypothetical protein KR018_009105 [Drosophila ironensis]|nr:hypothetical protein KR018_009105 [Drosophila ironensis]